MTDTGFRSPKYGDRGLHYLCTGPDPRGPRPGERLQAVIYDAQGRVVRRLEQIRGPLLQEGYVSFFSGPRDQPSIYAMPIVDIAPDGTQTVLIPNFQPSDPRRILDDAVAAWVTAHGVQQS